MQRKRRGHAHQCLARSDHIRADRRQLAVYERKHGGAEIEKEPFVNEEPGGATRAV